MVLGSLGLGSLVLSSLVPPPPRVPGRAAQRDGARRHSAHDACQHARVTAGAELAVEFVLETRMTAAAVADDEAIVLAMLGLPIDDPELGLLFG